MPPNSLSPAAASRSLYVITVVVLVSVVSAVGSAVADRAEGVCRGNTAKKLCPTLTPLPETTVSGTTGVVAVVQTNVAGIEFKVDDVALAPAITSPPFELAWDTRKLADGEHVLTATATDAEGNTATREHRLTVSNGPRDKAPPSVAFTSPAQGATVNGSVEVAATATDDVGVSGVQFKLDGVNLGSEDTSAPYAVTWDTTSSSNASHVLTALARDEAGNTVSVERNVTVANTAAPAPAPAPAPSPSPTTGTFLSDLEWTSATNGWGPVEKDRSNGEQGATDGSSIKLNGIVYAKGLGVHALSDVRYAVSNCSRFKADVGVDDEVGANGSVVFEVYAGAAKVYDSGTMTGSTATRQIDVAITGATELRLVVTDANGSNHSDHADWANARVEGCESAPQPAPSPSPTPPPPASSTSAYLSNLQWSSATNGWGPVERDMSNGERASGDGRTLQLNGVSYGKGLGVHAPSDVRFSVSGCNRFRADVGVDDEIPGSLGSVSFEVYAGSTKVFDSGVMNAGTATRQVDVSIAGATQLRLVVSDGGDGINYDHGDWANARIECGSDTEPPTVQLTSPQAGIGLAGTIAVAATASDNMGVASVQFKIDGANLGSEDTAAPYGVDWDTTAAANGSHVVTAVARDHAGNTTTVQRTVSVSNSQSSGPGLAWSPPTLTNAITLNVTNANRRLYLDNSRDYRLRIIEPLRRELWIEGGRHVVVIGGQITIDQLGGESSYQDNTAVKVRFGDPSGTVHLEGLLIDGPYVNDGIAIATARNVQIENVRIERVYDNIKGGHADCVQIQQGVGHLRVDGLTCTTQRQGIFLGDHSGPIRGADLRRMNLYAAGGQHLLWQTTATYPVALTNVWLAIASGSTQWAPFGYWAYPQEDGRTYSGQYDLTRRSQVSTDGSYMVWVGSSNTISGRANKGVPAGGDFVSRSSAGSGYVSPGYS